jgi:hypothetical protein
LPQNFTNCIQKMISARLLRGQGRIATANSGFVEGVS